jgi:ATP-dependent helicase/DNAse subunit B
MPTELYLAPAAGGKTEYALREARAAAQGLDAEVRVCVPTSLQAAAWRRRLAQHGGAIGVHVLTFDGLVAACLNTAGARFTELSRPVQYRLLRRVIARLPLAHYARIADKPGFIQVVADIIAELKAALVFPEKLQTAVRDLGDEPRLAELAVIYTAYQEALQANDWADRAGLQWLAVEEISRLREERAAVLDDWPLLIVDGFADFPPAQMALLAELAKGVGRMIVLLTMPEKVAYPRYRRTQQEVEDTLGVTARPLSAARTPGTSVLQDLARDLFTIDAPDAPQRDNGAAAVSMLEAPDRAAEVRAALRWLKQRIVFDGCEAHEVALLARQMAPYRAHARQIAAEFGLPLHFATGPPLTGSPVIAALLDLLRLHLPLAGRDEPSLPRRQVISAWRSPYFVWPGEDGITGGDADLLDTLARQQRVIRGLGQWREAFAARTAVVASAAAHVNEEEEFARPVVAAAAAAALENKFNTFVNLTAPPPGPAWLRDYVSWLERLIGPDPEITDKKDWPDDSLSVTEQVREAGAAGADDIAALGTLKEILRGLVWAEQAVGDAVTLSYTAFYEELLGAISAAHVELPAHEGQVAILAADVSQVRGLGFKAVAVLGLSEGSFPMAITEDPFLRDEDRAALATNIGARLLLSTLSLEREMFYDAVSRPGQQLLLTRPVLADNGAEWVASPYWTAVRDLLKLEVEQARGETAVLPVAAASWVEWWESVAGMEHLPAPQATIDRRAALERGTAVWGARRTLGLSPWQGDLSETAVILGDKYGPQHVWSAGRLESYQMCGFAFFTSSILDLAERAEPQEGLDVAQLGSIYHEIFEDVYNLAAGPDLDGDEKTLHAVIEAIAEPILDEAPRKQGFRETPWWSQTRGEIVANVVHSVIGLRHASYKFYAAEAAFGFGKHAALELEDGDDRLRLRGFIDRVDRDANGRIRIIDYKLAGPYKFTARAFAEGKKMQLPLYARAAEQALGLGQVADGFYWHYRTAEASRFTLADAEEGMEEIIATTEAHAWRAVRQIRQGSFAPRVPEGGCPSYCPAAVFCAHYAPSGY